MDTKELLKALALLQAFRQNLPNGSIEEDYVIEYHQILEAIQQQTGEELKDFFIPANKLEHEVAGTSPPTRGNHFRPQTHYTDERFCDLEFFRMKLDAAINYLNYLLPAEPEKRSIGF